MDFLLFGAAILPGVLICIWAYRMDKYEKEPLRHLLACLLLGVFITWPTYHLESAIQNWRWNDQFHLGWLFAFSVGGVGLVEEGAKFLVLMAYAYPKKAFNEPLDGIVYALLISMGFAITENILYAYHFGMHTTLVRAFTAIPAHASFAVFMGYYVGKGKFEPRGGNRLIWAGLFLAVVAHGLYDFFLLQKLYELLATFSLVLLWVSIRYARHLIALHQEQSPFRRFPPTV